MPNCLKELEQFSTSYKKLSNFSGLSGAFLTENAPEILRNNPFIRFATSNITFISDRTTAIENI